jgi:hypothetical protein
LDANATAVAHAATHRRLLRGIEAQVPEASGRERRLPVCPVATYLLTNSLPRGVMSLHLVLALPPLPACRWQAQRIVEAAALGALESSHAGTHVLASLNVPHISCFRHRGDATSTARPRLCITRRLLFLARLQRPIRGAPLLALWWRWQRCRGVGNLLCRLILHTFDADTRSWRRRAKQEVNVALASTSPATGCVVCVSTLTQARLFHATADSGTRRRLFRPREQGRVCEEAEVLARIDGDGGIPLLPFAGHNGRRGRQRRHCHRCRRSFLSSPVLASQTACGTITALRRI